MINLSGKTALITGATGGIGNAIALKLHTLGAKIAVSGTRQEKLAKLCTELGQNCRAYACNLNQRDEVKNLVSQVIADFGKIDILVNNAGITRDNLLMRMTENEWDNVLEVNLTATMLLCKSAMRPMMKQRSGRIINLGSVVGSTGNAGQTNYVASKAALAGFGKALAQEVASRKITVNTIAPGFIVSPMTNALTDAQKQAIIQAIPMAEIGQAEDIASAVAFLADDCAGYITGETLHINGGMFCP